MTVKNLALIILCTIWGLSLKCQNNEIYSGRIGLYNEVTGNYVDTTLLMRNYSGNDSLYRILVRPNAKINLEVVRVAYEYSVKNKIQYWPSIVFFLMDSYKVKDFYIVDFYLSVRNKALKNHSIKIKNSKVVAIDPLPGHSDGFIPIEEYEKEDDGIPILFEQYIPINENDSTDIYIE